MIRATVSAALVIACAATAVAGVSVSHQWVQVDNTVGNPGADPLNGAAWNANNWVTYDLFISGDFVVNGVNFGSAPGEEGLGLNFDTAVFNATQPLGSDVETVLQNTFAAYRYDTYAALGSNNAGGAANSQLITIGVNGFEPVDGRIRGAWAHNPPNGGTPQDASGGIRILRISFDGDAVRGVGTDIGTGTFEIGTADGVITYTIVPAPGAAGALALGGLVALRRRR